MKAKKKTHALREQHELAWQEYGCTLMSDGWTDGRTRHLVNFLVKSPAGTFFIDSVDISALVASKELLADLMRKGSTILEEATWFRFARIMVLTTRQRVDS